MAFLRLHGSIRKMEKLFDISYPTVKNRLRSITAQLDRIDLQRGFGRLRQHFRRHLDGWCGTGAARADSIAHLDKGRLGTIEHNEPAATAEG